MGYDRELLIKWLSKPGKPKYHVSKVTGKKYPYYHPNWTNHPDGTIRYCNFGDGRKDGLVHDLPLDEYPYGVEYEEPKIPKWLE